MSHLRLAAALIALPLAFGVAREASAHGFISIGVGLPGFGYPAYAAPPVAYAPPAPVVSYPGYSYGYGYEGSGYAAVESEDEVEEPAYAAQPVYTAPARRRVVHHTVRHRAAVRHDYCACNYH